jgi:hypothetical protein
MSRLGSCLLRGIALARGLCARSRSTARAFRADRGGNVTLIFALAIIPIFGAVAAPVDYGRGNGAHHDAGGARCHDPDDLQGSARPAERPDPAEGESYFNSQFTRGDVRNLNRSFALVTSAPGDFTVVGEAKET